MRYFVFLLVVVLLYVGLSWLTLRSQTGNVKLSYFISTASVFTILMISMYANLFFTLFLAAIILVASLYISGDRKVENGTIIKNGAFGGVWLCIPIYVYFINTT